MTNMLARDQDLDRFCREKYRRDLVPDDFGEVRKEIADLMKKYPFFRFMDSGSNTLNLALRITSDSNVHPSDAIHLAAAWENDITILLANDEQFRKEGNRLLGTCMPGKDLQLCNVKGLPRMLEDMGITLE